MEQVDETMAGQEEPIPLVIQGSTGDIGKRTLRVRDALQGQRDFEVFALVCHQNVALMAEQVRRYKPRYAVVTDEKKAKGLRERLTGTGGKTKLLVGEDEASRVCSLTSGGYVVIATAGFAGLPPTLAAIESGNTVAVANKQAFLTAGKLIMDAARKFDVEVLPIDSEPNAIWMAVQGAGLIRPVGDERRSVIYDLQRGAELDATEILLTCSGGPFLKTPKRELKRATFSQALGHITWPEMGRLNTINSASLMNKGQEAIEISAFFNFPLEKIHIVVHPESIVHSGITRPNGTQIVFQGTADMMLPIADALTFPRTFDIGVPHLQLESRGTLTFMEPDPVRFPGLTVALNAGMTGGTAPATLNGANEVAVDLFCRDRIRFPDMAELTAYAVSAHRPIAEPTLDQIVAADREGRRCVMDMAREMESTPKRTRRVLRAAL
jgi:1-deoxy-D-xylulose-5-phosphate reductoisomerase